MRALLAMVCALLLAMLGLILAAIGEPFRFISKCALQIARGLADYAERLRRP